MKGKCRNCEQELCCATQLSSCGEKVFYKERIAIKPQKNIFHHLGTFITTNLLTTLSLTTSTTILTTLTIFTTYLLCHYPCIPLSCHVLCSCLSENLFSILFSENKSVNDILLWILDRKQYHRQGEGGMYHQEEITRHISAKEMDIVFFKAIL